MDAETFTGADAKALRKSLGWNQREMGDYLGIKAPSVCRIEKERNGVSGPVKRLLQDLAAKQATAA